MNINNQYKLIHFVDNYLYFA